MAWLLLLLAALLVAGLPVWPHSRAWGYGPARVLGVLLLLVLLFWRVGLIDLAWRSGAGEGAPAPTPVAVPALPAVTTR